MYRRIISFFGGATSENSEDKSEELAQTKNDEMTGSGKTLHSGSQVANTMSDGEQRALHSRIESLEHELKVRTEESENYKNRLQLAEKELEILRTAAVPSPISKVTIGVGDGVVDDTEDNIHEREPSANMEELLDENAELHEALTKASEQLKDKMDMCDNHEKKNIALTNQIETLKEVVNITKDLLNIRDMEVHHLQSDVESMEGKIAEERQRHNSMITKMEEAVKLNSDLKEEYQNQLKIFQELKGRYEEKVTLLTKENEKLEEEVSLSRSVPHTAQSNQQVITDSLVSAETGTQ
ncbi:hypothetical protein B7P43_G03905 [Cryptotermes secundus]|uniref:Uncharacterized protein n=1 Tax=Cryptotermes secundus TaxID=105785 RepID=A0A2J7RRV0_9NEOP|nr:tropomyosin-1, isoforms 9A/A/B [Cryptotermes secundus]PNF43554.1 hypothetical protein B7P43_G03905 [Cryptotermes secundus]